MSEHTHATYDRSRERGGEKGRQTDIRNKRASKNLAKIFNHLSGM